MIVYLSLVGNVENFVKRTELKSTRLDMSNPYVEVDFEFVFITPSYDDEITEIVSQFIDFKNNKNFLMGFAGSGNINFADSYCFNAKELAEKYKKPLLMNFELSGTEKDVSKFKEEVEKIGITKISK